MLPGFVLHPDPDIYLTNDYLILDLETTNHEYGSALNQNNQLLLACWRLGDGHSFRRRREAADYSCWGDEFHQGSLLEHLEAARFVVAHFTKFELQWLKRCGAELRSILPYCTQIGEYVIAGNRKRALSLNATAARRSLGAKESAVERLIHEYGVNPADIPPELLQPYCEQDVALTERIFLEQRKELKENGLLPVAYCRNLATPVLADIEEYGMALDAPRVLKEHAVRIAAFNEAMGEFEAFTGGINPRSPPQMREYLYKILAFEEVKDRRGNPIRTKGGKKGVPQPRTDKKVLPLLKATTPKQKEFQKLAITVANMKVPVQNLEKMKDVLDAGGNIVHAVFNQTVTATHRLSSSGRNGGFQFHNFDRDFKRLFKARREGWVVVEADAPQLEFRGATELAGDPVAMKDILDGADIHAFTASILGVSRQDAKAHTFKPLYGGQSGTPKEIRYYEAFRKKYAAIYRMQTGWTHEALRTGKHVTPWGLVFYYPDTKMTQSGYITNTPSIFNYPVQSFATADIIPLTLVLLWHKIKDMPAMLVNTIHDSVILEVDPICLDRIVETLLECFTEDIYAVIERLYGRRISVPLGVGIKAGTNWGEGKEQKHNGKLPRAA